MTLDEISPEIFAAWREPREGTENPTRLDNPLWAALVREPFDERRLNAYQVNKRFGHQRRPYGKPTWCFDRFGQSQTALADGRTIYIAGEHEDYYDPDFFIYNDVAVVAPDATVAFYGYPHAVFPPTDFHTATLAGDHLWLVGSLGYADARRPGVTQVCRLDLRTLAIELLATTGDAPGWLHKHDARLDGGAIAVRGGLVDRGPDAPFDENIDEWALDLASLAWTRRTQLDWQRWALRRVDAERSQLWEIRQLAWQREHKLALGVDYAAKLVEELGAEPDVALLDGLYGAPELASREDDDFNLRRIEIDGVIVRIKEESYRVAFVVEGKLAEDRVRALQAHMLARLGALHVAPWQLE